MAKLQIINLIQTGDKVAIGVPRPEYEQLKEIADNYGISLTQLIGQVIRHGLADGYEVKEFRV